MICCYCYYQYNRVAALIQETPRRTLLLGKGQVNAAQLLQIQQHHPHHQLHIEIVPLARHGMQQVRQHLHRLVLKHLHRVETLCYCPQTFLSLNLQYRDAFLNQKICFGTAKSMTLLVQGKFRCRVHKSLCCTSAQMFSCLLPANPCSA